MWGITGGLTRSRKTKGRTGVPILSAIPVLGEPFKSTSKTGDKTELLVALRPVF